MAEEHHCPDSKEVIERLESETRGICVQSVLAMWYCGISDYFEGSGRISVLWDFRKQEALLRAYRHQSDGGSWEWRAELGLVACLMDVKQVFGKVSPVILSLVIKEMDIAPILEGAIFEGTDGNTV